MKTKTCVECPRQHYARGWCRMHYARRQVAGMLDERERTTWGRVTHGTSNTYKLRKCRCDECRAWAARDWQRQKALTGPERIREKSRASKLRSLETLHSFSYADLLAQQNGACAICRTPQPQDGRRLCIDHDHDTGKVRGLLCRECNFGLGHMKDDPATLMAAAQYLLDHATEGDSREVG